MPLSPAGTRTQKITVIKPADPLIRNADGEVIESYDEAADAWASISWEPGEETVVSQQAQGERRVTIRFPWSNATAAINSSWRIVQQRTGRTFGIISVQDMDERTREWQVVAVIAG